MKAARLTYTPPKSAARVHLPLSKSIAARLLVIALLAGEDPSRLIDPSEGLCDDLQVMYDAVCKLHGKPDKVAIDLKDSGTAKNLLTALCAATPSLDATLTMSKRLAERPMTTLLSMLGIFTSAKIECRKDNSLHVKGGKFIGCELPFNIDLSQSSQPCSALMLTAPTGSAPLKLRLPVTTVSRPYIKMTAELMRRCGAQVSFEPPYSSMRVLPSKYHAPSADMFEADWSAAAFFYEYALLSGHEVEIEGLCAPEESVQGDAAVARIFAKLGVRTQVTENGVRLVPGGEPVKLLYEQMKQTPDMVPAVAMACALKGIPFTLTGISHLRYKECDRLEAIRNVLSRFGVKVDAGADSLEMRQPSVPHAPVGVLPVFNDHRIAMALAMTAPLFPEINIENMECVNKSFPTFGREISRLGVRLA